MSHLGTQGTMLPYGSSVRLYISNRTCQSYIGLASGLRITFLILIRKFEI